MSEDTDTPHLLRMPDRIMEHIMKDMNYVQIFLLRGVCKSFRDFIDTTKPNPQFEQVYLMIRNEKINIRYMSKNLKLVKEIEYLKNDEGCLINGLSRREKLIKDVDFTTLFLQHFQYLLGFQQKKPFPTVNFRWRLGYKRENWIQNPEVYKEIYQNSMIPQFLESLKNIKKEDHVKIFTLNMNAMDQDQVISVLSVFQPGTLQKIEIIPQYESAKSAFRMDRLRNSEQWRRAQKLDIHNHLVASLTHSIRHFSRTSIRKNTVHGEELVRLKEHLRRNRRLECFSVSYTVIDEDELTRLFGEPFLRFYTNVHFLHSKNWYFSRPNSPKILVLMVQIQTRTVEFNCIERNKLPEGAVVRD